MQDEIAVLNGFSKFVEQVRLVFTAVEVLIVEDVGNLPELGSIHRHVGAPHEGRSVGGVGGHERNTDAGADGRLDLVQDEGLVDLFDDALGDFDGVVGVGVHQNDRELVSTESNH